MKKEETAIYLFNKALKTLYLFNVEASKQNAKNLCLVQLEIIKETLYNVSTIDDLHINELKKSINFYQKVTQTIQGL